MNYLTIDQCKDRFLYRLASRNLSLGVYNAKTKAFIGIRQKFGDEFLDTEYHWDNGAPHGTVHPLEELKFLPSDVKLEETLGAVDGKSGRQVAFDLMAADTAGRGWYFIDTGEVSKEIRPMPVHNEKLFNWLEENENDRS